MSRPGGGGRPLPEIPEGFVHPRGLGPAAGPLGVGTYGMGPSAHASSNSEIVVRAKPTDVSAAP